MTDTVTTAGGITYKLKELVLCKMVQSCDFGYPAFINDIIVDDAGSKKIGIKWKGWGKKHDTTIDFDELDDLLIKHTPELEAEHTRMYKESIKGSKSAKKAASNTDTTPATKKRKMERERSADSSQDSSYHHVSRDEEGIKIKLPEKLSKILRDDGDYVARQSMLVKLPATYTVDAILKEYQDMVMSTDIPDVAGNDEMLVEYERDSKKKKSESVMNKHDMMQSSLGVKDYFNVLVGGQLLYPQEREQYRDACVSPADKSIGEPVNREETPELEEMQIIPSSVYGVQHLIRLFMRIRPLLGSSNYGDKSLNAVLMLINDLLIFLSKNSAKYHDHARDYETIIKPAL